jgi:nucleoside-diphosphate-sugar epimerase
VQLRTPDVTKSKRLLGFEATTSLEVILDEVVPWITEQVKVGAI